jgi:hypothetical protein
VEVITGGAPRASTLRERVQHLCVVVIEGQRVMVAGGGGGEMGTWLGFE